MPVRIALRTKKTPLPFRDFASAALSALVPDPTIYLCSGSWDVGLLADKAPSTSATLRSELIAAGCGRTIHAVGTGRAYYAGIGSPGGYDPYDNFVKALEKVAGSGETHTVARIEKKQFWHAKILLVQFRAQPVVAVIGSSNMTLGASSFGAKYWNHEVDLIIWSPGHPRIDQLIEALGSLENGEAIMMQTTIDSNVQQPRENEQLLRLRDEIIAAEQA